MSYTVGIGRVCIDYYLEIASCSARFDGSKKLSAREIAKAVGGSVPRILSTVSATTSRNTVFFIGGCSLEDHLFLTTKLNEIDLPNKLIKQGYTNFSFILYGDKHQLISITSVEEEKELPPDDALTYIPFEKKVTDLLIDSRHPKACSRILEQMWDRFHFRPTVWLDPGSTAFSNPDRTKKTIEALMLADVVVASTDFFEKASVQLGSHFQKKLQLAVETMEGGHVQARGKWGTVTIYPVKVQVRGSSLGAGDVFCGVLIAQLAGLNICKLSNSRIEKAVHSSLQASAWRLASEELVPCPPHWDIANIM